MGKITGNIQLGIGLFILGIIGIFYLADKFFMGYSAGWYVTIIVSLVISGTGLVMLWKKGKHER